MAYTQSDINDYVRYEERHNTPETVLTFKDVEDALTTFSGDGTENVQDDLRYLRRLSIYVPGPTHRTSSMLKDCYVDRLNFLRISSVIDRSYRNLKRAQRKVRQNTELPTNIQGADYDDEEG